MNVHCDILHTLFTFQHKPKCKLRILGKYFVEISNDINISSPNELLQNNK